MICVSLRLSNKSRKKNLTDRKRRVATGGVTHDKDGLVNECSKKVTAYGMEKTLRRRMQTNASGSLM
jgi:hypothetical protein